MTDALWSSPSWVLESHRCEPSALVKDQSAPGCLEPGKGAAQTLAPCLSLRLVSNTPTAQSKCSRC